MSDVIDELKVQIDASTKSADAKLDKFIDKMLQLQSAITSVKMSNATNISNGLNQITSSVQNFNKNTKTADFTRIATGLNKLSAVDSGAISAVSRSMADFVSSMTGIERVHFDSQSFDTLAGSVAKLGRASITEAAQNLEFLKTSLSDFVTSMNTVGQVTFNADGLVSMVNSVSRLGSANAAQAVALLPQISAHLRDFVLTMNSVGSVTFDFTGLGNLISGITRLGGTKATQASANLKPIKEQLLKFVSGLNGIGKLNFDTTSLANLVSSITKLGGKAAGNAIPNIQNLGVALNQLMTTLAKAPVVSQNLIQMTTALANLAGAGSRVGSATSAMNQGFNLFSGSSKKVKTSSKGIASAIGRVYATYWMLFRAMGMFRKAMDISSDLTEVQNVVDVTFGNMKKTMEDFAKVSLSQYGMSALTAKDIASRYQAMGVAMGFSQKKMSGMSIELTKLAADMASFYNVDQKDVAKSLEAVFTGQTMPLRKYGIDLTQATLKQWALNNGLNANIKSMSAAEKMWLRYQYVMANSQQVLGDFARTSDSWHNQLVLLSGAFQSLGSIVGGSLINAFKPFIRALNSVMLKVIQFAEVVSNALGAIFGWKYESGGGISDDFSDAADSADDLAGSTGDAAKNTKKMADNLQSFDHLNVISSSNASGGSGGGGGGAAGGAGTAGSGGQWVETDSLWEKYTSSIDSLYKLGEYIGDALTKTLKGIDWDKIYKGADQFGIGLANFLNGLISPELFEAVGETVAGSLNTALHFLDSFGQTFEWTEFGNSIAAGINGFFNTFDFLLLADTLNVWAHGLLDTLITFLDKTEWDTIGTKIAEFLGELDLSGVGAKVGEALWKAINAGITVYGKTFSAAPIETTILTVVGALTFTPLGSLLKNKIIKSITDAFKGFNLNGILQGIFNFSTLSIAINSPAIQHVANLMLDEFDRFILDHFGESVGNALGESLLLFVSTGAGAVLGGPIGAAIGAGIGVALDTFIVKGEWVTKFWKKLGETLFNWDQASVMWDYTKQVFENAFNADNFIEFGANIVLGIISGISTGITWLLEPIADLFNFIVEGICNIFGIHSPAKNMEPYGQNILRGIIEGFKSSFGEWTESLNEWYNSYIVPWFTQQRWVELYSTMKTSMKSVWDETAGQWSQDINSWWTSNVTPWFTAEKWKTAMSGVKTGFEDSFNAAFDAVKQIWNRFATWLNSKLDFDIEPINIAGVEVFGGAKINLGHIPTFSTGGFPEDGLFMANHNELVGRFSNGQTAVANNEQITQGIAIGVQSANTELLRELKRNNDLLEQLLAKPVIDKGDVVDAWKAGAKTFRKQTGRQLGISY
jgi:hypothetical protein|nr:MAG TPA: minor tail protein [Caudoviricetes sp.]